MVEDDSSWRKWLSQMRVAMPISLEAIIASLVVTMVLIVRLIERIREPNKEVCHPSRGCDSPPQSKAKPPSGF